MEPSDKKRFSEAFAGLCVIHDVAASLERIQAYWLALQDLPTDLVLKAMGLASQRLKFFPKPAELRELVEPKTEDAALIAWDELCRAIDREGSYRSVLFTDGVLNATLTACGGWQYACGMKQAEFESFFRNRFLETYAAFKRQGKTSSETHIGITDQANGRRPREVKSIGELVGGIVGVKRIESEVA